jgi:hypothetical protein
MKTYYTEFPESSFVAEDDTNAQRSTTAKFLYRESDTPDGTPFVVLRDETTMIHVGEYIITPDGDGFQVRRISNTGGYCTCFVYKKDFEKLLSLLFLNTQVGLYHEPAKSKAIWKQIISKK